MAEPVMCDGGECPLKIRCKRHTAEPLEHGQAWFARIPYKDGGCAYFIPADNQGGQDHE